MPIKIIGKSVLGELGFSQNVSVMGDNYFSQLEKVKANLPPNCLFLMTAMTGTNEVTATKGEYFPKIRGYSTDIHPIFLPRTIYKNCMDGKDPFRPGCDFIIFNSGLNIVATTFSREAPILAFESSSGKRALGVILRPSLMKYGDYLFTKIKEAMGEDITVTLVTCNHFEYPEGSIPSIIEGLAAHHGMKCEICEDSEKNPECFHRGEKGNHIVALW